MKHLARQSALKPPIKRLAIAVLLVLWLAANATSASGQQAIPPALPAGKTAVPSDQLKRQEAFQIIWQTVNDQFYDAKFGGVDWAGARTRYQPLVARAASDREFHALMQQMLNELHQSHFVVIPRDSIPKIRLTKEPEDATADNARTEEEEAEEALDTINYKLTDRLLTGIGIDLRVLGGSAVVTRVEPGSAAARAGLRPGFVIKKVGSHSLDAVIAEIEKHPLWGSIIRPALPIFLIAGFINGELPGLVRLSYLDAGNRLRTVSIKRERLKGEMSPAIGNLPAMYTEFEARRLPGGLGYIRFNAFVPLLMEKLCGALRTMKDAPGIILDLRGNQGGLLGMVGGVGGLLETTPTPIGTMQTRDGRIPLFIFPQTAPYNGPLAILLDGSTQSAGEMFASGLQEAGRAVLVGEKSAGNTLPSGIKKLPTGAIFQYGLGNYETSSGKYLEGIGVSPDVIVTLSRQGLLRGGDPQLAAAIRRLRDEIRWGVNRRKLLAEVEVRATSAPPPALAAPPLILRRSLDRPPPVTIIETAEEPPPPPPLPPVSVKAPPDDVKPAVTPNLPSVESIFAKYLEASGGKAAFEKITSRVSTGTVEMSALGMTGTAEFDEQAADKWSVIIDVPGLGIMQRTFDGSRAWLQDPLQGLIRFTGLGLEIFKDAAVFNKQTKLPTIYPAARLLGKEKLDGKDAYVVQMDFEKWYFDAEGGLLLRQGNTYYDDYREVDGVKLPFRIHENRVSGLGMVYQLAEIKHNVKIDEAKLKVHPSCFTKP